jgi:penicillin-binding protein 1A
VITAATILKDEPTDFGNNYRPQNFDLKYRGELPAREALAQSLNIPSVEVMKKLGVNKAASAAQRLNISTVTEPQKYGLSLGLGTAEVKLLELANAYAAFANKGEQFSPKMIVSIKDKYDEKVERDDNKSKRVMSKEASFIISSILSDNSARAPIFGNSLDIDNRQVAVKTGTTNESRDAWTMGYTPGLAIGVWVGNNENEPMPGLIGSNSAGAIWRESMMSYLSKLPEEKFNPEGNITSIAICRGNGGRAIYDSPGTYREFFIKGTEPRETCNSFERQRRDNRDDENKGNGRKEEKRREEDNQQNQNEGSGSEEEITTGGQGGGSEPTPTEEEPPAEGTDPTTSP